MANTVLVVEDDRLQAEVAKQLLEHYGFVAILAADGREALTKLQAFRPDAILCNILMSGMDGYDTLRNVREDPRLSNIPFFYTTGLSLPEEKATRQYSSR